MLRQGGRSFHCGSGRPEAVGEEEQARAGALFGCGVQRLVAQELIQHRRRQVRAAPRAEQHRTAVLQPPPGDCCGCTKPQLRIVQTLRLTCSSQLLAMLHAAFVRSSCLLLGTRTA